VFERAREEKKTKKSKKKNSKNINIFDK
jgi:hypothetical protein